MADEKKKNRFGEDPFFCPASSRDWGDHEDDEYDGQEEHGFNVYDKSDKK